MELTLDMGAHARFVWPAYAAFALIFIGLFVWALTVNRRAKARLKKLETTEAAQ